MGNTTSFTAALAEAQGVRVGASCSIDKLLRRFDVDAPDEAAHIRAALLDPQVKHTEIRRALAEIGEEVGLSSIGRHRTNGCKNCNG